MNGEILCVGTELLLGDIVNTDAVAIARALASRGIGLYRQTVVGDNPARLASCLREALGRADLVVCTGGLGPTCDDLTRETVAEVVGRPLVLHEPSMARIRAYFDARGRAMCPNNEKQAMLPEVCVVFDNDNGTAPGCAVEDAAGKIVVTLPGPPRELEPMVRDQLLPYLDRFSDGVIVSHELRVFGQGESDVEHRLRALMDSANPTLAPYAKDGEVLLRATARAADRDEAEALLAPLVAAVKAELGPLVYGEDVASLQEALVALLRRKRLTIAAAESCTGGLVAQRLTEVPGASEVFGCGVVAYANCVKESLLGVRAATLAAHGAVSEATAREMAEGVRALAGSDLAVALTGLAGPGGGTPAKPVGLVYVACAGPHRTDVRRLALGADAKRGVIRTVASSHALHMALRAAEKL